MKIKLKEHNYPGKLIVFEGTDGAGKTTMIDMTYKYLSLLFSEDFVVLTKQPTDMSRNTKLFQKMMYCRNHDDIDYRAVQLLTMSDRIQHGFEFICKALQDGKFVICDRYIYTSFVNMLSRGYNKEKWFYEAAKHIIKPNITFLAYVPPQLAISRIKSRPEEARRHLDEEHLKITAKNFLVASKKYNFKRLDTTNSPQIAFEDVKIHLEGILEQYEVRK